MSEDKFGDGISPSRRTAIKAGFTLATVLSALGLQDLVDTLRPKRKVSAVDSPNVIAQGKNDFSDEVVGKVVERITQIGSVEPLSGDLSAYDMTSESGINNVCKVLEEAGDPQADSCLGLIHYFNAGGFDFSQWGNERAHFLRGKEAVASLAEVKTYLTNYYNTDSQDSPVKEVFEEAFMKYLHPTMEVVGQKSDLEKLIEKIAYLQERHISLVPSVGLFVYTSDKRPTERNYDILALQGIQKWLNSDAMSLVQNEEQGRRFLDLQAKVNSLIVDFQYYGQNTDVSIVNRDEIKISSFSNNLDNVNKQIVSSVYFLPIIAGRQLGGATTDSVLVSLAGDKGLASKDSSIRFADFDPPIVLNSTPGKPAYILFDQSQLPSDVKPQDLAYLYNKLAKKLGISEFGFPDNESQPSSIVVDYTNNEGSSVAIGKLMLILLDGNSMLKVKPAIHSEQGKTVYYHTPGSNEAIGAVSLQRLWKVIRLAVETRKTVKF